MAHRITPREKSRARRRTHGLNVKLLEFRAGGGESIKVRGFDFGTVPTDVGPAVVIGENENDIRSQGGGFGRGRGNARRDDGEYQEKNDGEFHGGMG